MLTSPEAEASVKCYIVWVAVFVLLVYCFGYIMA